ncbi:MAG: CocE/NonD family hydrolase [Alphaproteobacteria bacterium]
MKYVDTFPRPIRLIETAWIEMPDGAKLAARIYLPEDAEENPVPAVLEHIPYRRRDYTRPRGDQEHGYLAGHGYAGVRVDIRGSGDSDGVLDGEYLQQELDDAVAVINWLAEQPWCSGEVGMCGISWGGFNGLQVAAMRPEPLKAIITTCSTDDRYADDIHYMGGCLITDNVNWSSTMFAFNSRPADPQIVGDGWREQWLERLRKEEPWIIEWLRHQRRDDFWKHGSVCENFSDITCAVYAVSGWADGYSNAVPRLMENLDCPRKGLVGPWPHSWPYYGTPGPQIGFMQEAVRWWDYWLKGIDNGIMDEPMYRAWMQDSAPPSTLHETRSGRWIAENEWPSPHIEDRALVLNDGSLDDTVKSQTVLTACTPQMNGKDGGEWCPYGYQADEPDDQREDDAMSMCFDTEPLETSFEIFGAPVAELEIAVDQPNAFLAVRLTDVAPDGASTMVTYGLLNLNHDEKHETVSPLEPGKRRIVHVKMNDIAHVFPAGHRVRVAVSTTYWQRVWPSPRTVTLSLSTGSSKMHLPVREPRDSDANLPAFGEPECYRPGPGKIIKPSGRGRKITTDSESGITKIESIKNRGEQYLEDIDLTITADNTDRFFVKEGDPLSARHESDYDITMVRDGWSIRTECRTVMTSTEDDFNIKASLKAFENGDEVFSRTWDETIPRDGN